MKRLVLIAALMALPASVYAAASAQDGQSFRGVTQIDLVGGMIRADSSAKALTMSSTGGVAVYNETPINSTWTFNPDFYGGGTADTFSVHGRTMDSTTVFSCASYGRIVLMLKMEGHHGAAGGVVRIGVTPIWSWSSGATDTSVSFSGGGLAAAGVFGTDSVGVVSDVTASALGLARTEVIAKLMNFSTVSITGNAIRSVPLVFTNPGAGYVRFIFRVLSDTGTTATQGSKFKLRAAIGARAL